jgi:transposase
MPKTYTTYTTEFKEQAVSLVRKSNRRVSEVVSDLGLQKSTLYNWLKQSDPSSGVSFKELEEIKRLKKELARAELERDILKKATAYFAKDVQ